MQDSPADVIKAAISSAFVTYQTPENFDWERNESWIKPDECAHLTNVVLRELEAKGFQIVKKTT